MVDVVPEGKRGAAQVKHFEVSREDSKWTAIAAFTGGDRYGVVHPRTLREADRGRTTRYVRSP